MPASHISFLQRYLAQYEQYCHSYGHELEPPRAG